MTVIGVLPHYPNATMILLPVQNATNRFLQFLFQLMKATPLTTIKPVA